MYSMWNAVRFMQKVVLVVSRSDRLVEWHPSVFSVACQKSSSTHNRVAMATLSHLMSSWHHHIVMSTWCYKGSKCIPLSASMDQRPCVWSFAQWHALTLHLFSAHREARPLQRQLLFSSLPLFGCDDLSSANCYSPSPDYLIRDVCVCSALLHAQSIKLTINSHNYSYTV